MKVKKIWADGPEDNDDWWVTRLFHNSSKKCWEMEIEWPRQSYQHTRLHQHLQHMIYLWIRDHGDKHGFVGPSFAVLYDEEIAMLFYMTFKR